VAVINRAHVALDVQGVNTMIPTGSSSPAIRVPQLASSNSGRIEITSETAGQLTAIASTYAAGIGGANGEGAGLIAIGGNVRVVATGGNGASSTVRGGAGIGGGQNGAMGQIAIGGQATVYARTGTVFPYAAAIGASYLGSTGNQLGAANNWVHIEDQATVVADVVGAGSSPAIGVQNASNSVGLVKVSGGLVVAHPFATANPAISSGNNQKTTITGGSVLGVASNAGTAGVVNPADGSGQALWPAYVPAATVDGADLTGLTVDFGNGYALNTLSASQREWLASSGNHYPAPSAVPLADPTEPANTTAYLAGQAWLPAGLYREVQAGAKALGVDVRASAPAFAQAQTNTTAVPTALSITADGQELTESSTQLTLTLNPPVPGLSLSNLRFVAGTGQATPAGKLATDDDGATYTLALAPEIAQGTVSANMSSHGYLTLEDAEFTVNRSTTVAVAPLDGGQGSRLFTTVFGGAHFSSSWSGTMYYRYGGNEPAIAAQLVSDPATQTAPAVLGRNAVPAQIVDGISAAEEFTCYVTVKGVNGNFSELIKLTFPAYTGNPDWFALPDDPAMDSVVQTVQQGGSNYRLTGLTGDLEGLNGRDLPIASAPIELGASFSGTHSFTVNGASVPGVSVRLRLNGVDLVSGKTTSPISLTGGALVDLTVDGTNALNVAPTPDDLNASGLGVLNGARVAISSATGGTLTATGRNGAGIGSASGECPGEVSVDGNVKITAVGNWYGPGIGGSCTTVGARVTIGGTATVTATGGYYSAGIGAGDGGLGPVVEIGGSSTVTATGAYHGAGIGGGGGSASGSVHVGDSATVTATGGSTGAGIGSGGGSVGGVVVIDGAAKVKAQGELYGAGIGGSGKGAGGAITITGSATVDAISTNYGAGIGGGGGNVNNTADMTQSGGTITITGQATVTASSAYGGAAIGGGWRAPGGTTEIGGQATVTAPSSSHGAGIGGGGVVDSYTTTRGGGGYITITDSATVTASSTTGSGIGGGNLAAMGYITISGAATVRAENTNYGAGIGANGASYYNATNHVTITGTPTVVAYGYYGGIGGGTTVANTVYGSVAIKGGFVATRVKSAAYYGMGNVKNGVTISGGSVYSAVSTAGTAGVKDPVDLQGRALYPVYVPAAGADGTDLTDLDVSFGDGYTLHTLTAAQRDFLTASGSLFPTPGAVPLADATDPANNKAFLAGRAWLPAGLRDSVRAGQAPEYQGASALGADVRASAPAFAAASTNIVAVPVELSVTADGAESAVSSTELTLRLDPSAPGLALTNVSFTPGTGEASVVGKLTTDDDGQTYAAALDPEITQGTMSARISSHGYVTLAAAEFTVNRDPAVVVTPLNNGEGRRLFTSILGGAPFSSTWRGTMYYRCGGDEPDGAQDLIDDPTTHTAPAVLGSNTAPGGMDTTLAASDELVCYVAVKGQNDQLSNVAQVTYPAYTGDPHWFALPGDTASDAVVHTVQTGGVHYRLTGLVGDLQWLNGQNLSIDEYPIELGESFSGTHSYSLNGASVAEVTVPLRLNGVTLTGNATASPLGLTGGASLALTVDGVNTLTSAFGAGLGVPEGTRAVIASATGGSLTATGSASSAGIGGGNAQIAGAVDIDGNVQVTAEGGAKGLGSGAGIGGGYNKAGGKTTIRGHATVKATGGTGTSYGAAGIGGGTYGGGGTIAITDSATVTATGSKSGAGIGGGAGNGSALTQVGGEITIDGSATVKATSPLGGAAIGGGWMSQGGTTVIGGQATVTATAASAGAGIGGGGSNSGQTTRGGGGYITITDSATVTASSYTGSGIGGGYNAAMGYITISGQAKVQAQGRSSGAGIGGSGTNYYNETNHVTITGTPTVLATGVYAGIGGSTTATNTVYGSVVIEGGFVSARPTSGSYYAIGNVRKGVTISGGSVHPAAGAKGTAGVQDPVDAEGWRVYPLYVPAFVSGVDLSDLDLDAEQFAYAQHTISDAQRAFIAATDSSVFPAPASVPATAQDTTKLAATVWVPSGHMDGIELRGATGFFADIADADVPAWGPGLSTNALLRRVLNVEVSVNADQGHGGSTALVLTFDQSVPGLKAASVQVTDGTAHASIDPAGWFGSGDYKVWTLPLSEVSAEGTVTVNLADLPNGWKDYVLAGVPAVVQVQAATEPDEGTDGGNDSGDGTDGNDDGGNDSGDGADGNDDGGNDSGDGTDGSDDGGNGSGDGTDGNDDGGNDSGDGADGNDDGGNDSGDGTDGSGGTGGNGGNGGNGATGGTGGNGGNGTSTGGIGGNTTNNITNITNNTNITNGTDGSQSPLVTAVAVTGAPTTFVYKAKGPHTAALAAVVQPVGATASIAWKVVSGPASIDPSGVLTFTGAEGEVRVTASVPGAPGAVTEPVAIRVVRNVSRIRTPVSRLFVQSGKKLALPVALDDSSDMTVKFTAGLKFTSSNPKAATVDAKGIIKAKKVKKTVKTTITVKAANGKALKVKVTVVPKAKKLSRLSVSGTPAKSTLAVGKTAILKVKHVSKKATGVRVTFTSSNPKVLTVDKAGKIIAKSAGKASITVKAAGKTIKTKKITVKAPGKAKKAVAKTGKSGKAKKTKSATGTTKAGAKTGVL
jgi:hypothetical protein